MLFPIPDVSLWSDPGPFPINRWVRRLWRGPLFKVHPQWVDQYHAYHQRLLREQEELERHLREQAEYEAMIAEYDDQGEHMALMLPLYLHNQGLSYRRSVQDRKTERHYERVDYCTVESWYYDESAYYFWINTWDFGKFPYGLSISMFKNPDVAETLSVNFGSEAFIEVNKREHQHRPGLWIVVMHKAGRGLIPRLIHYSDMIKAMPKSSPLLAFPVGVGRNGQYYYGDMDELVTILIVGSKGAGKSNTVNGILTTWLSRVQPSRLRLFLTDLKGGLEFYDYHGIPHLGGDVDIKMRLGKDKPLEMVRLGQNIMTEPGEVIPVLKYIEEEMNRRFDLMKGRAKKITAYNRKFGDSLSYWCLVIDELATLMDSPQANDAKSSLSEIARKGRAVGIYMILATQIPDKTVLNRQVAGNMDCRIVGRVADGASSALSIGDGSWDAVYLPKDIPGRVIWRWSDKLVVQAPFIPDTTVKKVVNDLRQGILLDPQSLEEKSIAMELFSYAADNLAGLCSSRDLFNHFKNRIAKHKIESTLKKWEVQEGEQGFEPRIPIGDNDYFLAPTVPDGNNGKLPRQLIKTDEFEQKRDYWLEIIKLRLSQAPRPKQVAETVTEQNLKTSNPAEPEQPENIIDL